MYNKYGADELGMALVITSLLFSILATITNILFLYIVSWICLIYEIYRMLSKNYVKRRLENDWYVKQKKYVQRIYKVTKNNIQDKQYHYYLCPTCHQMVRVPKGKGKITITCPSCKHTFDKKS